MAIKIHQSVSDDLREYVKIQPDPSRKDLEKLDEQLAQSVNYGNQENFVDTLKRNTPLNKPFNVYCKLKEEDIFYVQYPLNDTKAIEYTTKRKSIDDYILLYYGRVGDLESSFSVTGYKPYDKLNGTWNTGSAGANYTTEIGASFEGTVTCAGLNLWITTDNRGGVFDIIIDGDESNPVRVSTWRDSSSTGKASVEIFRFNEVGTHTIKGVFKGDDPAHVPSSGAGTARGWIVKEFSNFRTFELYGVVRTTDNSNTPILHDQSNKEFAFNMREQNIGDYYFTPSHNSANTSHYITEPKFVVDGEYVNFVSGDVKKAQSTFSIIQKIYSRNPDNAKNLAIITTIITFKASGEVSIDGKLEALVNLEAQTAYNIMTPVSKTFSEKMITSIRNTYLTNKSDGSNEYLANEKDRTSSFLFIGSQNKNTGLAVTYNNPQETLRWGQDGKRVEAERTFLQHRDNVFAKLYQQLYSNSVIPKGYVHRWSGTFFIGYYEGLYDLF